MTPGSKPSARRFSGRKTWRSTTKFSLSGSSFRVKDKKLTTIPLQSCNT